MKIPTAEEREIVLNRLREAMVFQIGLWDAATEISDALDCELSAVLDFVNASAIVANDGMELSRADLDDLLGIGLPGRVVIGKPLGDSQYQVH